MHSSAAVARHTPLLAVNRFRSFMPVSLDRLTTISIISYYTRIKISWRICIMRWHIAVCVLTFRSWCHRRPRNSAAADECAHIFDFEWKHQAIRRNSMAHTHLKCTRQPVWLKQAYQINLAILEWHTDHGTDIGCPIKMQLHTQAIACRLR